MSRSATPKTIEQRFAEEVERLTAKGLDVGDIPDRVASFQLNQDAARSPRTIETYVEAVMLMMRYLATEGLPTRVEEIRRPHIEKFLKHVRETRSSSTANNRYRALQQFFKFVVAADAEADEAFPGVAAPPRRSPMDLIESPPVDDRRVPIITDEQLEALFQVVKGRDFNSRRDNAILRLFLDTGMRKSEMVSLKVASVHYAREGTAIVMGKGSKERACPFDVETAQAIDAYLRVRRRHQSAESPWMWLGRNGRLQLAGLRMMVDRRARQAGIEKLHPHKFRHTFAHQWMLHGGQEGALMVLAGWETRTMVSRYGRSAEAERAVVAHKEMRARQRERRGY